MAKSYKEGQMFNIMTAAWLLHILEIESENWDKLIEHDANLEQHMISEHDIEPEMIKKIYKILLNNPMIESKNRRETLALMNISSMLNCQQELLNFAS